MESSDSGGSSAKKNPFMALFGMIFSLFLIGLMIWSIKIWFREPELRYREVCHYPYLVYRTIMVDAFSFFVFDDPVSVLTNSQKVRKFNYDCIQETITWKWLK